jgi:hypothetical protein
MAGMSSRFFDYGFKKIKYELPIKNKRMIDCAIESLGVPNDSTFLFVTRYDIELPGKIIKIDKVTEGPACSAFLAYDHLDENKPLIVTNCDQILEYNYDQFISECSKYDGCVMTYTPAYELNIGDVDKNSFISFNPTRVTEKIVISNNALTGVHYFKTAKLFKEGYEYMVNNNIRAPNGEFYISLVYRSLVELGYDIGMYKLGGDEHFYPVGEPLDYFKYIGSFPIFSVYDGYQFGTAPVVYKKGKIYVEGDELTESPINYTRGWMIGDFEPSFLRRKTYEVGYGTHSNDQQNFFHVHEYITEVNLLLEGELNINGHDIKPGSVFIIPPGYICCPLFTKDCKIICVKTPSIPSDKVLY